MAVAEPVYVGRHELTIERLVAWSRLDAGAMTTDDELDDSEWVVDLTGKVLYLGSCASLRVSEERLEDLRRQTGASLICGYEKNVEWVSSGAFDVMLISALADAMDRDRPRPVDAIRRLRRVAGDLLDELGFVTHPG